eukprot:m.17464 g.17464  ORF g.17464 m.17464 type:complete len:52 (+) comp7459_c0_seq1:847-1002(+)
MNKWRMVHAETQPNCHGNVSLKADTCCLRFKMPFQVVRDLSATCTSEHCAR